MVDNYGSVISPIKNARTYDMGITDWESTGAPTNREGTLTTENVVVTYQLKTVYYVLN